MKIITEKQSIINALTKAQGSTSDTMPGVLLAADEIIQVTTTNLSEATTADVAGTIIDPGRVVIDTPRLLKIVKDMPGDIEIENDVKTKSVATIKSGSAVFKLSCISLEDFPDCKGVETEATVNINARDFRRIISQSIYATGTESQGGRRVLEGVCFEVVEGKINAIGTDGRRIAVSKADCNGDDCMFVIPRKPVGQLLGMLDTHGVVEIGVADNAVCFQLPGAWFRSQLIEGVYPDYKQVIPEPTSKIIVQKNELSNSVRRVALITSKESASVKLEFRNNKIVITTQVPEIGESKDSLEISYTGQSQALVLNPVYIRDALACAVTDEIEIGLIDSLSPVKITSENYIAVVMPQRIC